MTHFLSSDGLTTCGSCRRHVVAGTAPATTICPFCTKARSRQLPVGALAIALMALACGPAQSAGEEPSREPGQFEPAEEAPLGEVYGAPPAPERAGDDTPESNSEE